MTPQQPLSVHTTLEKSASFSGAIVALYSARLFQVDLIVRPLCRGDLREHRRKRREVHRKHWPMPCPRVRHPIAHSPPGLLSLT